MKKKKFLLIPCFFILILLFLFPLKKTIALMGSTRLNGTVIVIDPGHGGYDPGAKVNRVNEDEINLQIGLKLRKLLKHAGADVIMTREADYDLSSSDATHIKRSDMMERATILNQENVTLFISIHGNISLNKSCRGSEVYYRIDDNNSKALAQAIQDRLKVTTNSRYQIKKGDFYLLNQTTNLGILVEVGFLSNPTDLNLLQKENYQEKIALDLLQGINDYLKILQ